MSNNGIRYTDDFKQQIVNLKLSPDCIRTEPRV